jgi:nicotinamide-nucleotide amidase
MEKPVGTVCFGWAVQGRNVTTLRKQFTVNRQEIRVASCEEALSGVLLVLTQMLH